MPTFNNDEELSEAATDGLDQAMNYMMGELLIENEKKVQKTVYDAYSPDVYKRTDDFKLAWDIDHSKSGKSVEGEFYFEPSNLSVNPSELQHTDIYGDSVADEMADLIYQSGPGLFHRPTKRNAWKKTDKWFSKNKITELYQRGMKRAGLPIKKSSGDPVKISHED